MATGRIPINGTAAIQQTIVDAKGDLIVATGADAVARLAVGTDGHTLVADSVETTGLKWVAPAGGGKVLQVVSATTASGITVSTNTFTDSGLTASITPSAATSKILILITQPVNSLFRSAGGASLIGSMRLLRDAVVLSDPGVSLNLGSVTTGNAKFVWNMTFTFLDNPATTSAITYKTQGKIFDGDSIGFNQGTSTITLLEIGA